MQTFTNESKDINKTAFRLQHLNSGYYLGSDSTDFKLNLPLKLIKVNENENDQLENTVFVFKELLENNESKNLIMETDKLVHLIHK